MATSPAKLDKGFFRLLGACPAPAGTREQKATERSEGSPALRGYPPEGH
jgi:hypothetical protein